MSAPTGSASVAGAVPAVRPAREVGVPVHRARLIADLLMMITWRDIRIKYKQSVMGLMWAILMPGLIVAAGLLVQLGMSHLSGRPFTIDRLAAICVKSLPWAFFVGGLRFATNSLVSNANLITKINCPRVVFPISAVLSALFDLLVALAPLVIILAFTGVRPMVTQWWALPLMLFMVLFVAGLGIAASAVNLFFRDIKYLVEIVLTFAIFFTPVFYSADLFGPWRDVLLLNPVAPLLEGLDQAVVHGVTPSLPWVAYSAIVSIGTFLGAWVMFHRLEPSFADNV